MAGVQRPQCPGAACLVRPAWFGHNPQTASSNRFQNEPGANRPEDIARNALLEFDAAAKLLAQAGIPLCIVEDDASAVRPDAVFPNNWISFHDDGTVVTYPMLTPNRRSERRNDLPEQVAQALGFRITRYIDLSHHENAGRFLEGTGSLVLDHVHRLAYANRSARTDERLVNEWCRLLGYTPIVFDAATPDGTPVYHTNVLLWIGEALCGVGLDWIAPADRGRVLGHLAASGRQVLVLGTTALRAFAGNMLELRTAGGQHVLAMSGSAWRALEDDERRVLASSTDQILTTDLPTIERYGGGSIRCMLAGVPQ